MDNWFKDEQTHFLAKSVWMLFWLNLIGIVGISSIFDEGTVLHTVFLAVELLLGAAIAALLIKMGGENRGYTVAGWCRAAIVVYDAVIALLSFAGGAPVWAAAGALLIQLVDLIAAFFEMTAHAAVTQEHDPSIADGWKKLRLWYLISVTVIQISSYLGMVNAELAATVAGTAAMVLVVVSLFRLVSLYRTAKFFRKYG